MPLIEKLLEWIQKRDSKISEHIQGNAVKFSFYFCLESDDHIRRCLKQIELELEFESVVKVHKR